MKIEERYLAIYSDGSSVYLQSHTYDEALDEAEQEIEVDSWTGTEYCSRTVQLVDVERYLASA